MKLLPLILVSFGASAEASIVHVDIAGTMTSGFSVGETITVSLDFDTSKNTTTATTADTAYYAWAAGPNNWIDASFSLGAANFDATLTADSDVGLLLRDAALGAPQDEWHEFYIGRQFTPITPFTNGLADALLGGFRIETYLFDDGDFIQGLGKEQIFDLSGNSLGTGRLDFGYSLVHEFDGGRQWNQGTATVLSSFTNGTFNITSARAVNVPEPSTITLFGIGLIGAWAIRRRQSSL